MTTTRQRRPIHERRAARSSRPTTRLARSRGDGRAGRSRRSTGAGDSCLRERPLCSHLTAETIRGAVLDALFEDADEEAELVAGFRVRLRELIADTDRAVFISLFDAEPQVTPAFDQFRSELLQCMPAPQDARSEQFGR